jgi:predicted DNA-binding transcriptional regulator
MEDERKKVEDMLTGKTMQVYLYLLKTGKASGVREIQKALGFSSPSIAHHHLEKLLSLGIVEKDSYERYVLAKKVDIGVLGSFVNFAGITLPRLSFYAAFFSVICFAYIISNINFLDVYALVGTAGSAIAFWFETFRILRRSPF